MKHLAAAFLLIPAIASAEGPQLNSVPVALLTIPFCGQGANATDNFLGPATTEAQDLTVGGATCDGLDAGTAAGADNIPWGSLQGPYTVVGLYCQMTDTGTNDTVTFTLMDDTVAVSGVSCTTAALDGAGVNTCVASRIDTESAVVGAGSLLAIRQTRSETGGADDLSLSDAKCYAFVGF